MEGSRQRVCGSVGRICGRTMEFCGGGLWEGTRRVAEFRGRMVEGSGQFGVARVRVHQRGRHWRSGGDIFLAASLQHTVFPRDACHWGADMA